MAEVGPGQSRQLRRALFRSHMTIAAIGAVVAVIGMGATWYLSEHTERLASRSGPAAQAANEASEGLRITTSALRGWMALPDPRLAQERKTAWKRTIWPALAEVEHLSDEQHRAGIDRVKGLLRDLEEWQWHIEQIAHQPGNLPGRLLIEQRVAPLSREIVALATSAIEIEKDRPADAASRKRLTALADLRAHVSQASASLQMYVILHWSGNQDRFRRHLETASRAVARVRGAHFTADQAEIVRLIREELEMLAGVGESAIAVAQANRVSVAQQLLRDEAAPMARQAAELLSGIARAKRSSMHADAERIAEVGDIGNLLMFALLLGMMILATGMARYRSKRIALPVQALAEASLALTEGRLTEDLPVRGNDELATMTRAFNTMRRTLQDAREAAEARNDALARENKLQGRLSALDHALRGHASLASLGESALTHLGEPLGALVGTLWVNDAGDLRLGATIGWTPGSRRVEPGVARAALKRSEPVVFSEIEASDLEIRSSLLAAKPRYVVLVPMAFQGEPLGVLELGSLREVSPEELGFLAEAATTLGTVVTAALAQEQQATLLRRTQEQAAKLEQQTEELRVQQEEMTATNEELEGQAKLLRRSEALLQAQQEELRQANEELEQQTRELETQRDAVRGRNAALKEAQAALHERAEQLQQASRTKSEFLANMSHELRTPLNSMLILSRLLSDNRKGNLTEKQVTQVKTIHKAGNDLLELINEILDLSKIEAGRLEMNFADAPVASLIESLEAIFAPQAATRGIEFRVEVADDVPKQFHTDEHRLQQVLRNLCSNAVKFTSEGSVTVAIDRHDGRLRMRVIDTGVGIPKEAQAHIWNAFQQADGTTSREYGGTGLGLTITMNLVKKLGGEISLESEPGEGSTFTLLLPLSAADAALEPGEPETANAPAPRPARVPVAPPKPDTTPVPEPERAPDDAPGSEVPAPTLEDDRDRIAPDDRVILVVEDDPIFGGVLRDLVRERGFRALLGSDGVAGVALARHFQPMGIVLDMHMPRLDGWGVLQALKEDEHTRHIPVHVISADERAQGTLQRGAIGALKKPVSPEDLHKAISRLEAVASKKVSRLLVIEDDEAERAAMQDLLDARDTEVICVDSGARGLERISEGGIDCVVLDLRLPDMTGFDVLEKIGELEEPPPVIVYTGRDLDEAEVERLGRRADSIIVKGVHSPDRLLDETTLFLHSVQARLPEHAQEAIRRVQSGSGTSLAGRKVLVVDDDMRNVFALSTVLESHEIEAIIARNGQEALDKLAEDPTGIEAVLLDVMMPVMDGYECAAKIRENPQWRELPVIMVTAKAMSGDAERCMAAGASDYMPKPLDMQRLLSLLRVWIR